MNQSAIASISRRFPDDSSAASFEKRRVNMATANNPSSPLRSRSTIAAVKGLVEPRARRVLMTATATNGCSAGRIWS